MKYSTLTLHKTNNIELFKDGNKARIKSETSRTPNSKEFKLKNRDLIIINDYYEYRIDNKDFSQLLENTFWKNPNSEAFSKNFNFDYHWSGCIGPFGYFWDKVKILSLLRFKLNRTEFLQEDFVKQHLKSINHKNHNQFLNSVVEEFQSLDVPIYCNRLCGCRECGTLNIKIEIHKNVKWIFEDKEVQMEWIFDKEQYLKTLNTLLIFLEVNKM